MPKKAKETFGSEKDMKKETKKVANRTEKEANSLAKKATARKTTSKKNNKTAVKASAASSLKKKKEASSKKAKATSKVAKKTTASRKSVKKIVDVPEHYDLPYHYNQTIVKILAQTPKTLFVYWDVSENDRLNYEKQYGNDFFNNTVPFLRVKNETYGYSFDVDVDDFANGWYIHVEDPKSNYSVELHRTQRQFVAQVIDAPVYITSSNNIETPNDHILFDSMSDTIYFRNIKTNQISNKNITNIYLLRNTGKIYNIYNLYKEMYKSENVNSIFDLNNPSSGNHTSTFK